MKYELELISEKEYNLRVGKSFATVGTRKVSVHTNKPIHLIESGEMAYGCVSFSSYEDYLKYTEDFRNEAIY